MSVKAVASKGHGSNSVPAHTSDPLAVAGRGDRQALNWSYDIQGHQSWQSSSLWVAVKGNCLGFLLGFACLLSSLIPYSVLKQM